MLPLCALPPLSSAGHPAFQGDIGTFSDGLCTYWVKLRPGVREFLEGEKRGSEGACLADLSWRGHVAPRVGSPCAIIHKL